MSTAINHLIEQWKQAVVSRDIDKIVSFYADDIVSFDAVTALQFKGRAAYRAHWEECMKHCPDPVSSSFMNCISSKRQTARSLTGWPTAAVPGPMVR